MYTEHFGLTEEPFSIAANPRFLYMSASHREALGHLLYGIGSDSGFVLLTGEVGTGKTTVCRCLLQQLPEDTEVAFILNPRLSAIEMLQAICDELEIVYSMPADSIKNLVDSINLHLLNRHAEGRKTVVIIDEAQNLSVEVLEQLRLLTNLETDERKLIRIILIGQPELAAMLARPELKQLEQRITARYHLRPLKPSEIGAYVSHRLAVAGRRKVIFPERILPRLYARTKGIPRLINVICDRAMLGAYVNSRNRVNNQILIKAADEVQGRPKASGWLLPGGIAASVLLVGVATAAVIFYDNPTRISKFIMPPSSVTFDDGRPRQAVTGQVVKSDPGAPMEKSKNAAAASWSQRLDTEQNTLALAQKNLLTRWGRSLPENFTDPCASASEWGLRCFTGVGNLGSLIGIDRPVILSLYDARGRAFHATLLSVTDQQARIVFAHGDETLPLSELETYWRGEYHLLWKLSPQGYAIIRPGRRGDDVIWLTTRLVEAGIDTVSLGNIYDSRVTEAVKTFQRRNGLLADGIAGRQTLMRLNSSIDDSVPRLVLSEDS